MKTYYFDYAAATPMSETVLRAMQPYFTERFYNPSASYLAAQESKQAIDQARKAIAEILGAKPSEIIFTAGGTEADNLAITGVMQQFPDANVVVSAIEHEAVLAPAAQFNRKLAPVLPEGRVDVQALIHEIDDHTVLVSVMYANNEIGTVQPLGDISKELQKIRKARKQAGNSLPIYLHTDACQAGNYLKLLVTTLGVDLMTLNGGKIYGPKQSGILFVRTGTKLEPQIRGGGQERNYRSGTENVPAIVGLATALHESASLREQESSRLKKLQEDFIRMLVNKMPNVCVNGSLEHRLPNNIHLTFPGQDNERLMMELDERGLMVATGSACSASSEEPSHVLKAIGLSDEDARSSLRITFGRDTTNDAIDSLAGYLSELSQ